MWSVGYGAEFFADIVDVDVQASVLSLPEVGGKLKRGLIPVHGQFLLGGQSHDDLLPGDGIGGTAIQTSSARSRDKPEKIAAGQFTVQAAVAVS